MKYKLYDELLNGSNILSHVFLNCLEESSIITVANKNKSLNEEEIKNREIEIYLKIDGIDCDPSKFFNLFWEQYNDHVKKEATKIVKTQTSGKINEIIEKLDNYNLILEELGKDINWNTNDLFLK